MYIIKPVAFGDEDSRGNFQNGLNNAGIMSGKIISQVERNVNLACYIPFGQVISAVRKDTDVQIGVDGLDIHCGSQNQIIREILPDADIQGTGIFLPEGFYFFDQTKLGIHELGLLLIEDLSGRGKGDAGTLTVKQLSAQLVFQHRDAPAQGGLRDIQSFCRFGKTAGGTNAEKIIYAVKIHSPHTPFWLFIHNNESPVLCQTNNEKGEEKSRLTDFVEQIMNSGRPGQCNFGIFHEKERVIQ